MTKKVAHRFGIVEEEFVEYLLKTVNDCYDAIGDPIADIVDLCLFERSSAMDAYIDREKENLGIKTSAFEAAYFAVHDAWRGTPRIMVAQDRMLSLPELIRTGVLHHEVAHTILHGSLEFYSFPPPKLLLDRKDIPRQVAGDILYLVSVAVKDYEATRLLHDKGFVKDQVAYCKYILQPSEEDYEAWTLAQDNKSARVLVLVSVLKTSCCAAPLLRDKKFGEDIDMAIIGAISYLPSEWYGCLMGLLRTTSEFGQNTHENVDLFVRRIIEELGIGG